MDARSLSSETQNYLRQQAIRLRQKGKTFIDIADYLGVHRNTVTKWWNQYEQQGEAALKQQTRGRQIGTGRRLSKKDEEIVLKKMLKFCPLNLINRYPDEIWLKYFSRKFSTGRETIDCHPLAEDLALWTRYNMQALVETTCGVDLPARTMGEYLKRWGVVPQKPLEQSYSKNSREIEQWKQEKYPQIATWAKLSNAEIFWGDSPDLRPRTGHEQEERPVNFIAGINNKGSARFMLYPNSLTPKDLGEFLARLTFWGNRNLFLITHRHSHYESEVVKARLAPYENVIQVFYLP